MMDQNVTGLMKSKEKLSFSFYIQTNIAENVHHLFVEKTGFTEKVSSSSSFVDR